MASALSSTACTSESTSRLTTERIASMSLTSSRPIRYSFVDMSFPRVVAVPGTYGDGQIASRRHRSHPGGPEGTVMCRALHAEDAFSVGAQELRPHVVAEADGWELGEDSVEREARRVVAGVDDLVRAPGVGEVDDLAR